jgi:hypothetical protein
MVLFIQESVRGDVEHRVVRIGLVLVVGVDLLLVRLLVCRE